jgi:glucan phosphoethanolaminetransferase (alkaline phosphatase superfamily)
MHEQQTDILTESILEITSKRKKQLLPWWIKVFMWIFLVFGAIVPFGLIFGIFGYDFDLAIYGLNTNEPYSVVGMTIFAVFILKGVTSYGLVTERNWAIKAGISDAVLGIVICISSMVYAWMNGINYSFRGELLLLIPYLIKLNKIRSDWENTIEI